MPSDRFILCLPHSPPAFSLQHQGVSNESAAWVAKMRDCFYKAEKQAKLICHFSSQNGSYPWKAVRSWKEAQGMFWNEVWYVLFLGLTGAAYRLWALCAQYLRFAYFSVRIICQLQSLLKKKKLMRKKMKNNGLLSKRVVASTSTDFRAYHLCSRDVRRHTHSLLPFNKWQKYYSTTLKAILNKHVF